MKKPPKFREDGEPDGRGHAEGSKATQFAHDDGRRRPGRTKGAKSLRTIMKALAATGISLDNGAGRKRRITTMEGIALKLREKALRGDFKAMEFLLDRFAEFDPPEEADHTAALLDEDQAILASAQARGLIGTINGFGA